MKKLALGSPVILQSLASAPTNPVDGMMYWDSVNSEVKVYKSGSFKSVGASEFADNIFRIIDDVDGTKKIAFAAQNLTTGTTRTITMPDTDVNLGLIATALQSSTRGAVNGVASLDGSGKVPTSQIPDVLLGQVSYQGTWNANTNTPNIAASPSKGYYYVVSTSGATNLGGITDWVVGDWAIYNGTGWDKVDNTDKVSSINGQSGAVTLTTDNINQGTTNKYYSTSQFNTDLASKTTDNLAQGTTNKLSMFKEHGFKYPLEGGVRSLLRRLT